MTQEWINKLKRKHLLIIIAWALFLYAGAQLKVATVWYDDGDKAIAVASFICTPFYTTGQLFSLLLTGRNQKIKKPLASNNLPENFEGIKYGLS
jgi:hypothetical protein